MGLSVITATLIIVTALVLSSAQLARTVLAGTSAVDLARADAWIRADQRDHTSLVITACCTWTGLILRTATIEVTNTGTTVLNASRAVTNVLIDGVLKPTTDITSTTVGGAAADTWAPGDKLVLVVRNVATTPAFVKVVGNNGAVALWRAA